MDHDHWGAIFCITLVVLMFAPSTFDKLRRKAQARKTTKPDSFFDGITEFQNDFA